MSAPNDTSTAPISPGFKRTPILLIAGAILWLGAAFFARAQPSYPGVEVPVAWHGYLLQIAILAAAAALALFGPTRDLACRGLDHFRTPSPGARLLTTLIVAILAFAYLWLTAIQQGRDLIVREQDESMYLIQAQLLAKGKVALPAHPLASFFESFHIFVHKYYAPHYFPGQGLLFAAGITLGIAPWLLAIALAAAAVGLIYRVIAELLDGVFGLLGALMLISLPIFRRLSIMVMSHMLLLVLALALTWIWLRWRKSRSILLAIAFGLLAGWAAITRPLDALCIVGPLCVAILIDLRTSPWPRRLATLSAITLAAVPFLALQLHMDKKLTGHWLKAPPTLYHETYFPEIAAQFPSHSKVRKQPVSPTTLPQFKQYRDNYWDPAISSFRKQGPLNLTFTTRFPMLLGVALPAGALLLFLPLGVCATGRLTWPVVVAVPLFLLAYMIWPYFRWHYGAVVFPGVILIVLAGVHALARVSEPWRSRATAFGAIGIAGLCATMLPQLNPTIHDQLWPTPILSDLNRQIASLPDRPAVVLVRHRGPSLWETLSRWVGSRAIRRDTSWSQEPVYNIDVANPDDAPVIRAHDLGPRNREIYHYYAQKQPNRTFYLYDKTTAQMTRLGLARELAASHPMPTPATQPASPSKKRRPSESKPAIP